MKVSRRAQRIPMLLYCTLATHQRYSRTHDLGENLRIRFLAVILPHCPYNTTPNRLYASRQACGPDVPLRLAALARQFQHNSHRRSFCICMILVVERVCYFACRCLQLFAGWLARLESHNGDASGLRARHA